jgi:hypothetical protein
MTYLRTFSQGENQIVRWMDSLAKAMADIEANNASGNALLSDWSTFTATEKDAKARALLAPQYLIEDLTRALKVTGIDNDAWLAGDRAQAIEKFEDADGQLHLTAIGISGARVLLVLFTANSAVLHKRSRSFLGKLEHLQQARMDLLPDVIRSLDHRAAEWRAVALRSLMIPSAEAQAR